MSELETVENLREKLDNHPEVYQKIALAGEDPDVEPIKNERGVVVSEEDLEEAVERMRKVLEHSLNDDPTHMVEIDLQHAFVALGVSPKHLYPDDVDCPEYWYDEDGFPNEDIFNNE